MSPKNTGQGSRVVGPLRGPFQEAKRRGGSFEGLNAAPPAPLLEVVRDAFAVARERGRFRGRD